MHQAFIYFQLCNSLQQQNKLQRISFQGVAHGQGPVVFLQNIYRPNPIKPGANVSLKSSMALQNWNITSVDLIEELLMLILKV